MFRLLMPRSLMGKLLVLVSALVAVTSGQSIAMDNSEAVQQMQNDLLQQLIIEQGQGKFVQQKYFSFLKNPITSSGQFIVSEQAVLWQTKSPVFAELLVNPQGIYQRLSTLGDYQILAENTEYSTLFMSIFNGRIKPSDWQVNLDESVGANPLSTKNTCLALTPKTAQLKTLFQKIILCTLTVEPTNERDDSAEIASAVVANLIDSGIIGSGKRQIDLIDQQGNKTVITMTITNTHLSHDALGQLRLPNTDITDNVN